MWLKEFEKELRDLNQPEELIQQEVEICQQQGVSEFGAISPKTWAEMITM
jgi:hypothetical protein